MSQMTSRHDAFTLKVDGNLFTMGFAAGLIIGKLVLRSTMLSVAFATGLGLAVGTSASGQEGEAQQSGTRMAGRLRATQTQ